MWLKKVQHLSEWNVHPIENRIENFTCIFIIIGAGIVELVQQLYYRLDDWEIIT
jgi:hypothetical protein